MAGILRSKQMSIINKPQKRWMKSVLQTSTQPIPPMPFQRGQRSTATREQANAQQLLRRA